MKEVSLQIQENPALMTANRPLIRLWAVIQ